MYEVNNTEGSDPDHNIPADLRVLNLVAQVLPELVHIYLANNGSADGRKSLLAGYMLVASTFLSQTLNIPIEEITAGLEHAALLHKGMVASHQSKPEGSSSNTEPQRKVNWGV